MVVQPRPNLPINEDEQHPAADRTMPAEVVLSLPASREWAGLARLVTAAFASRMGFSVDEVDDLRIGVDELCFALLGSDGRGHGGTVDLRFCVNGDELLVEGEAAGASLFEPVVTSLSAQILREVCDTYELGIVDGRVSFRMRRRRHA